MGLRPTICYERWSLEWTSWRYAQESDRVSLLKSSEGVPDYLLGHPGPWATMRWQACVSYLTVRPSTRKGNEGEPAVILMRMTPRSRAAQSSNRGQSDWASLPASGADGIPARAAQPLGSSLPPPGAASFLWGNNSRAWRFA